MHELSLIASLFEILEEKAAEKEAKRIVSVTLQVGMLSGAIPELLKASFDIYKKDTIAAGAELETVEVPFKVECNVCHTQMIKDDLVAICDACGSTDLKTLQGTDLFLLKMDVEV
jgi:hydrogenase nickel incorporation protein HypA/HybF